MQGTCDHSILSKWYQVQKVHWNWYHFDTKLHQSDTWYQVNASKRRWKHMPSTSTLSHRYSKPCIKQKQINHPEQPCNHTHWSCIPLQLAQKYRAIELCFAKKRFARKIEACKEAPTATRDFTKSFQVARSSMKTSLLYCDASTQSPRHMLGLSESHYGCILSHSIMLLPSPAIFTYVTFFQKGLDT